MLGYSGGHNADISDIPPVDRGSLPDEWKKSKVVPVFKSGVNTGMAQKRCLCGQVANVDAESQIPGWKVRREVSIQCNLLPLLPPPLIASDPVGAKSSCAPSQNDLHHPSREAVDQHSGTTDSSKKVSNNSGATDSAEKVGNESEAMGSAGKVSNNRGATYSAEKVSNNSGTTDSAEKVSNNSGATDSAEKVGNESEAMGSAGKVSNNRGATYSAEKVSNNSGTTDSAEKVSNNSGATDSAEKVGNESEAMGSAGKVSNYSGATDCAEKAINVIEPTRKVERLRCQLCPFTTKSKYTLKDHMLAHTGDKCVECPICLAKFAKKYNVVRHMQRTHPDGKLYKSDLFKCDLCQYKTGSCNALENHMRIHAGGKLHACDMCPYVTSRASCLARHMRTHTGDKPFKCDMCPFVTAWQGTLTRHIITRH
uniref:Glass n=1 Tax=Rhipicephalus zambeziensis TaxID=60191 RepID=A0A224YWZ7_9ACAR